jgi:hypothetical protein
MFLSRGLIEPFNGCFPAVPSILSTNGVGYFSSFPRSLADAIVLMEQPFLDASL